MTAGSMGMAGACRKTSLRGWSMAWLHVTGVYKVSLLQWRTRLRSTSLLSMSTTDFFFNTRFDFFASSFTSFFGFFLASFSASQFGYIEYLEGMVVTGQGWFAVQHEDNKSGQALVFSPTKSVSIRQYLGQYAIRLAFMDLDHVDPFVLVVADS